MGQEPIKVGQLPDKSTGRPDFFASRDYSLTTPMPSPQQTFHFSHLCSNQCGLRLSLLRGLRKIPTTD